MHFDWLVTASERGDRPFAVQAGQRVLWDPEALETKLDAPLSAEYYARLASARDRVRDST